jgi:RNA polymerase sigma-70 factor (ECF subfamily)
MSAEIDPIAAQRPRLFGLAYRMLGSPAQAEDVVQEAYARWYAQPRDEVLNEAAFLTTVVTRLCLDQLKSARAQRERYPGVWLPEPLAVEPEELHAELGAPAQHSAEHELERLESISLAFLALLESLTPLERAVYLLHEVFGYSHAEVAAITARSEAASRQIHRRAKQSLQARKPAVASPERHRELLAAFLAACQQGDLDGLTRLLAEDVVSRADGGGHAAAAIRPVAGARAVARLYRGFARRADPDTRAQILSINGWPSLVLCSGGVLRSVIQIRTDGERIDAIHAITNPEKLARLAGELGLTVTSG